MNKQEFLTELRAALSGLPQDDIEERLSFYEEMIDDRMEEGMTEEEAVASAGKIEDIASQTLADVPLTNETNTYAVEGSFQSIDVASKETDVFFKPSEDGKCSVVCVEKENVKHTVTIENGTLKIGVNDREAWFNRLTLFHKSRSMTVYLPEKQYKALSVDTHTGDVHLPADFSFECVDVKTSTGDVDISARVSEKAKITTSTGDVKLSGLTVGALDVSTSTGDVTVDTVECAGDVFLKVRTGEIRMKRVTCRSLKTEGSTGDVYLTELRAETKLHVERSTGEVRFDKCDAGEIFVKTSTSDVTGSLLSSKVFITKTFTGKVRVPDSITGGRCEITTSTGDIRIEINEPEKQETILE